MATIEELDFKLIIDDADFNAKVSDVLKTAQDLNANLSQILDIKQKISSVSSADVANQKNANKILADNAKTQEKIATDAERAAQARRKVAETTTSQITRENAVNREKEAQAAIKTQIAQEKLNQLQERGRRTLQSTSRLWQQMAAMAATYFSVAGATRLVRTLVDVSAEFELQKTTLGAILQDTQRAGELYEQIKDLAVQSPFAFKELTSYAKQLSAYSIPVGELYDTTKMLADVSAGLGVGMDRLVLAYGQIRSASFLRGQEVRQLTEAGIPILEELRKQFVALGEEGITVGDVFDKISKRLVPFSMVEKVFKDMTSEGGKFYQMQEVQAETLKGKISNLTDAYQIMFSEIGEKHEGLLKGSVDALRGIADNYQKIGTVLVGLITTYGMYRAALIAVKVYEEAALIAGINHTTVMASMSKAIKILTADTKAYIAVQKLLSTINWGALGVAAVIGIAAAFTNAAIQAGKFRQELDAIATDHANDARKMVEDYRELVKRLEGVTQGSQEYRDAISELNRKYGEYLPNLLTEKTTLAELRGLETQLTNAILTRARAYAEAEGLRKIEDRYGKSLMGSLEGLSGALRSSGLAEAEANDFIKVFRDTLANSTDNVATTLSDAMRAYLGEDGFKQVRNSGTWQYLVEYAETYADDLDRVNKETERFQNLMSTRFGFSGYGSREERQITESVNKEYREREKAIRNLKMSADEAGAALENLEKERLSSLITAFKQAEGNTPGVWTKQINELEKKLSELNGGELSTFQKLVNPLVTGEGVKDLMVQPGEKQSEYFDKLRKDYKTVAQDYKDADAVLQKLVSDKEKGLKVDDEAIKRQKESVAALENRKKVIESIGETLGISIDDKVTKPRGNRNTKTQTQIDLENEINSLKDLYTWYKKFKDLGFSDERTSGVLAKFFPDQADIIKGGQLEKQLLADADAMEAYGDAGKKAAAGIRDFLNVGGVRSEFDSMKDQFQAFDKYRQKIQDWMDKDYGIEDEGVANKISVLLARLATQNAQAVTDANEVRSLFAQATEDENVLKSIREIYGEEVWEKYMENGEKVIDDLLDKEISANKKVTQEKINALAEQYVRQQLFEKNLDLTDWGDKSLAQIRSIQTGLEELYNTTIPWTEDLQAQADKMKITFDQLAESIKKMFGNRYDQSVVEEFKKMQANAKEAMGLVSEFGNIISNLGDGIDNEDVARLGKVLDTAGEILVVITESESAMAAITKVNDKMKDDANNIAQSSDLWTMAIKIALIGLRSIVDSVTENYERQLAINKAAAEYRDTMHDIRMSSADTIFGTDSVKKAEESIRNLKDSLAELQKTQNVFAGIEQGMSAQRMVVFFGELSKLRGSGLAEMRKEWQDAMNGSYEENQDFFEWIIANQEIIRSKLYQNQKADFDKMIQDLDRYKAALEEYDSMMQDMFGSLAGSIADSLINAFMETGDAATDLASNMQETFSDLGKEIARSLISSFVISNILDKYRDTVEELFGYMSDSSANPDVIAQKFGELADNITQDADAAAQFTNALLTAMQNNGIDLSGDSGTKAMGNGIKSITEDTANLLASYINAIRADVSVTRTMVATILGLLPSAPTLSEYLAQIQANTYNTAVNTQFILERLDSTMAAFPNGGRAFNVNIS